MNVHTLPAPAAHGTALPGSGGGGEPLLPELVESALAALRRRWLLFLAVVLSVLAAGAAYLSLAVPTYSAAVTLKIDPSKSAALGELSVTTGTPDQLIVDTEVNQMHSPEVARAVVASLGLAQDPVFSALAGDDFGSDLAPREREARLAELLLANMQAVRRPSTYLVELRYRASDAALAARIANAFAAEYVRFGLRQRALRAAEQAAMLQDELQVVSTRAAEAQQRLADYKASAGIISTAGTDATLSDRQLAALTLEQATAQSEAAAAAAKLRAAEAQLRRGGLDSVSAVLSSAVVTRLREQRAVLIKSRDDVGVRYGPLHPQSRIAEAQLASLDGQIHEEAERIVSGLRSEAASASARAASLDGDIAALEREKARETRGSAYSELYAREADSAQTAYDRLAERAELSERAVNSSISPAQIVEAASEPEAPASPNRRAIAAGSAAMSILLGLGAVALAEALSARFTSLADVRRLGVLTLGCVQKVGRAQIARHVGAEGTPADLLVACPFSSYTESLRTTVTALVRPRPDKVFAIASSLPDEGKSTVALSLARSLALGGWRVLAVDADLRRGGLSRMAGIRAQSGLAEVLQGRADLDQVIVRDMATRLDIVPIARPFSRVEAPFGDQVMALLLAQMRVNYDAIILDTPPIIGLADGRLLARLADATALVIRWNDTPQSAVMQAIDTLATHEANLAGVILSMVGRTSDAYGGQHFSRKYRHYYQTL